MKNTLIPKLLILAIALATLTGCPALTNLIELMSGRGAATTLEITDIPKEFYGDYILVAAVDPADTSAVERSCGNMLSFSRVDSSGNVKVNISSMGVFKTDSKDTLATGMNVLLAMAMRKPCDSMNRILGVVFIPSGAIASSNDSTIAADGNTKFVTEDGKVKTFEADGIISRSFTYTNGANISNCDPKVSVNDVPTYSFSGNSTLKFSAFKQNSDCSEEYIVINESGLIVRDTIEGKEVHHFATGEIIKVISPKETVKTGDSSWTKIYYKDEKGSIKKGWVIELFPTKTQGGRSSIETQDAISLAFTPTYNYTYGYSLPTYIGDGQNNTDSYFSETMVPYDSYTETYITTQEVRYKPHHYQAPSTSLGMCYRVSVYKNIKSSSTAEGYYYYARTISLKGEEKYGWINEEHVDKKYLTKDGEGWKPYFVITKNGSSLQIREIPSTADNVPIGSASPGSDIKVYENCKSEDDSWAVVNYNGIVGWAAKEDGGELMHKDVPIETDDFPKKIYLIVNVNSVVGSIDKTVPNNAWTDWSWQGGELKQRGEDKRYEVAVLPKIIYREYPDDGRLQGDEFNGFSRLIDVVIRKKTDNKICTKDNCKVIKGIVKEFKEHSYNEYDKKNHDYARKSFNKLYKDETIKVCKRMPCNLKTDLIESGKIQTGLRYPNAKGSCDDTISICPSETTDCGYSEYENCDNIKITNHFDGSIVEFCGESPYNESPKYINEKLQAYDFGSEYDKNAKPVTIDNINDYGIVRIISNIYREKECLFSKEPKDCQ